MSTEERINESKTEYMEMDIPGEEEQYPAQLTPEDQEFAAKVEARRKRIRKKRGRSKRRNVVLMVIVFAVLLTMCSREIVRLQAENRALKKQHAELEQERDRLTKELSAVGDKEYIKEQARKQLRLLDPGEIMFIFEDEPVKTEDPKESKDTKDSEKGESDEKDEGSND